MTFANQIAFTFTDHRKKDTPKHPTKKDVSISVNDLSRRINITLRKNAREKIAPKTMRVDLGIAGSLLAFREVKDGEGWKITGKEKPLTSRYIQIVASNKKITPVYEWAKKYEGSYDLEYDELNNFYSITSAE